MKSILLATAAATAFSASAFAADLPKRAVAPVAPSPIFTWTGFYVGANAGYGFGEAKSSDIALNGTPFPSRNGSFHTNGALGGVQLGYNHQFGNVVLGVETDIAVASIRGSYVTDPTQAPASQSHVSSKMKSLGTIRARAGYAVNNVLLYVTGGFAYGSSSTTITNFINRSSPLQSASYTQTGYTVGAGAEYAFTNNWTVKAEYLFVKLNKKSLTFIESPVTATTNASSTANIVRVGLNYKF